MDLSKLRKNVDAIESGLWVGNIPKLPGVKLKVRGYKSVSAFGLRNQLERRLIAADREPDGSPTMKARLVIINTVLADAVLLDWDGIEYDGKPIYFSADNARKYLSDPALDDFSDGVFWAAQWVDQNSWADDEAPEKVEVA